ncbi:hypothetical protein ACSVBT_07080 [Afipia sp. TerB]
MPLAYNSERGEVPLTIGGVDLVIAAEMGAMASVSKRLGCQSFADLYLRLVNAEPNAVLAGVELLAVKGDVGAALKKLSIKDLPACKDAFVAALLHHADDSKNGEAAKGNPTTPESPGGDGMASRP